MEGLKEHASLLIDKSLTVANEKLAKHDQAVVLLGSVVAARALYNVHDWVYHNDVSASKRVAEGFFAFVKSIPILREKIQALVDESKREVSDRVKVDDHYIMNVPKEGQSFDQIVGTMKKYVNYDTIDWRAGNISGTTFTDDKELTELCAFTYKQFMLMNPLHPDCFKALRKMEAEIIAMTLHLYNGPADSCGMTTQGGTESLGLAVLAARNRAFSKGIKWPEIVMGHTVHAGVDKAAHYFRVKMVKVGYQSDYKSNVKAMRRAITKNTCLLIGSAPAFSQGLIDELEMISNLAVENDIPMHVDACMGGFLLPFAEDAGHKLPLFDFRLPGVTSISADCHKYGYCPKGVSVLMFRTRELRREAIFRCTEWSGGIYATPTYSGSRAGGHIAACWATMNKVGRQGYVEKTRKVIDTCIRIRVCSGLTSDDLIEVLGSGQSNTRPEVDR